MNVGRNPKTDATALARAQHRIEETDDIDQLRAAQAVLLPLLGLTLKQTAAAIGRSRFWVSRARSAALAGQPPPKAHGGRRKALVAEDDEVRILRQAIEDADLWLPRRQSGVRAALHKLLEQRAGAPVAESTVTAFLNRVVPRLLPQSKGADIRHIAQFLDAYWVAEQRLNAAIERAKRCR
jgi:hypothetical protein